MRPRTVIDFTKIINILTFPYSIGILKCAVLENIHKPQVTPCVYPTLFGQDARPWAWPRRPRSEEEARESTSVVART